MICTAIIARNNYETLVVDVTRLLKEESIGVNTSKLVKRPSRHLPARS